MDVKEETSFRPLFTAYSGSSPTRQNQTSSLSLQFSASASTSLCPRPSPIPVRGQARSCLRDPERGCPHQLPPATSPHPLRNFSSMVIRPWRCEHSHSLP